MVKSENDQQIVDSEGLIGHLTDAEVIVEREDDLTLSETFERVWYDRMGQLRDDEHLRDVLQEEFDIDSDEIRFDEDENGRFNVRHDGTTMGTWTSEAAFVADIALYTFLDEWFHLWDRLDGLSRSELLSRLRGFLERCPLCDGHLELLEQEDEASGGTEVTILCAECDRIVFDGTFF